MRQLAIWTILFLCSCSGGTENISSTGLYPISLEQQISDWQEREAQCQQIETKCPDGYDIYPDLIDLMHQIAIEYSNDMFPHWDTSCEASSRESGSNCVGMSAITLRAIENSCLHAKYSFHAAMRGVQKDNEQDHMVVVIYHDNPNFGEETFIIDNFYIWTWELNWNIVTEFPL